MSGVKGRSGGYRPGAGRPKKVKATSTRIKNNYIKAARKLAKEFGMPVEEAMLRMVYDPDVQDSVKASIMKSYNDALIAREVDQHVNVASQEGPAIMLPPMLPDPALAVVDGGKGKK
jgi:hypothetical protein